MTEAVQERKTTAELGAIAIIDEISYMLDPEPNKIQAVKEKLVGILQHAERIGEFYEYRTPDKDRELGNGKTGKAFKPDQEYVAGREGYATAYNAFEKSISEFDKYMAFTRSFSLVNGKNPMNHVLKIVRTCAGFLSAISAD